ncbi:MAG: hypothetical protein FWD12_14785 [Alphaproteobacteria bacterium]|nr:hypothetical protein [Alphaproteobacteria bacterium]
MTTPLSPQHPDAPAQMHHGETGHLPKTARGSYRRDDRQRMNPQIVARFDRGTFEEIAGFAAARGLSFNSALRCLAIWGLRAARKEVPPKAPP